MQSIPTEILDPTFLRQGEDLQDFLLSLLKGGLDKQARDALGLAAVRYVNRRAGKYILKPEHSNLDDKDRGVVDELRKFGFSIIDPVFTPADMMTIDRHMESKPLRFGRHELDSTHEKVGLMEERPTDAQFGRYSRRDTLSCPPICALVHNKQLIKLLTSYLGAPPTISIVEMWWSFPTTEPAQGMQLFHHDRGDFRSCNLFVYLTDVTEATGPHSFVAQTHELNTLYPLAVQRFGKDPTRFNKFWKWMEVHRKSDSDVCEFFNEDEIKVFTGPKGTNFLEDTRGLHKATVPILGPRLAFEIVFSTLPKYNETPDPVPRNDIYLSDTSSIHSDMDPLVKYATRLMYR